MSSSATPQHEPTMEEILASIRKIISEDQPEAAAPAPQTVPQPAPVQAVVEEPAEVDVLELTEEVHDEQPAPVPAPAPPVEDDDIAFETIEAEPKAETPVDDLISESTRSAIGRAFANVDPGTMQLSTPASGGGTLDALFLRAIQDAFTPTLLEWVDNHNAEIIDRLKPLIRDWMDENLPSLIEAAVTKEIRAQAAAARAPRRR
ncbi:MAG TPA: DUF2497 domain-containing protein [Micropepsaceae bacterium]|nr:DUF2497 domain-containing protein [Micropepsaceae bacterium]